VLKVLVFAQPFLVVWVAIAWSSAVVDLLHLCHIVIVQTDVVACLDLQSLACEFYIFQADEKKN
jgi:hypothetical protein